LLGGRFLKSSRTPSGNIDRFAYDESYDPDEPGGSGSW
ncbi:MAG: hypothetical protein JWM74_4252, partial [Myxococcaceae bacterium]|nr:hypothetical protein [Myxococcaceae bacterium]